MLSPRNKVLHSIEHKPLSNLFEILIRYCMFTHVNDDSMKPITMSLLFKNEILKLSNILILSEDSVTLLRRIYQDVKITYAAYWNIFIDDIS